MVVKLLQLEADSKLKSNKHRETLIPALKKINLKAIMQINAIRDDFKALSNLSGDAIKESIKNLIKARKSGNCKEEVNIVFEELKKLETNSKKMRFQIVDKEDVTKTSQERSAGSCDHVFIVTGIKQNAQIDNPVSWGNRSVCKLSLDLRL